MTKIDNIAIEVEKQSLYQAPEKIFPREIRGRFQTMRNLCVIALLGLYYGLPWLQWGGRQAVLLDLPARKFHIFGLTFWPQDFIFLALLLILAGLALFFFTAIAGRVWCGYACPQTVWTEAFIWMERWVEGSRAQQIKLDAAKWNFAKFRKRASKQFLWISFSLITGLTFVGYFTPIDTLVIDFFNFQLNGWLLFWVVFYGFATYGNAGFMREQVCKYMCPYARFQSAMFDKDTLIVAYDSVRGEPRTRGKKRKDESALERGDCIDCGICVQVCPTGIDIRDGLQYECIACAACIDACDEVMEKVSLPRGLIKYSSESQEAGNTTSLIKTLLRPRVVIYAGLLGLVLSGFGYALLSRANFQVDILRDRNALFSYKDNHTIENIYRVKLMNKSQHSQKYAVAVIGAEYAQVKWSRPAEDGLSRIVKAGDIGDFSISVSMPLANSNRRSQIIELSFAETLASDASVELQSIVEESRFWGPKPGSQ